MVVLHAMFNSIVGPTQKTQGHAELLERYSTEVTALSNEALVARTIFKTTSAWSVEDHQAAHDTYLKQRSKPKGLHSPRQIDAAISLELAERYRQEGRTEQARKLIIIAVENCPNDGALLELEKNFMGDIVIDWKATLFPRPTESIPAPKKKGRRKISP